MGVFDSLSSAASGLKNAASSPIEVEIPKPSGGSDTVWLHHDFEMTGVSELRLEREEGPSIDFLAEAEELSSDARAKAREIGEKVADRLGDMKEHAPSSFSDAIELAKDAAGDPSHPVSATILTGLALIMAEASGFGVFMIASAMLGAMLSPTGWLLIPAVVFVAYAYRDKLRKERVEDFSSEYSELKEKYDNGEIEEETFESRRRELTDKHFG
jgi:uncharacterized membrane protein